MYPSHFIHYKIIGIFAKNSFRFRLDYYFDYYTTTKCKKTPILSAFSSGSKGARTPLYFSYFPHIYWFFRRFLLITFDYFRKK
nr:MAG TPA: hypothetical protein [Bacteriophage sp.]